MIGVTVGSWRSSICSVVCSFRTGQRFFSPTPSLPSLACDFLIPAAASDENLVASADGCEKEVKADDDQEDGKKDR